MLSGTRMVYDIELFWQMWTMWWVNGSLNQFKNIMIIIFVGVVTTVGVIDQTRVFNYSSRSPHKQ